MISPEELEAMIAKNEKDLPYSVMLECQRVLAEKHQWNDHDPEDGIFHLLWIYDELGEVTAILKKKGMEGIMEDAAVRRHFLEELSDVLMYFFDLVDCYRISPEELSEAYLAKWRRNMDRTWEENKDMYED